MNILQSVKLGVQKLEEDQARGEVIQRDLFGGAITADIQTRLLDATTVRQVPDNQEVFFSLTDGDDSALIVDILEEIDAENLEEAAKKHFEALADDNDASELTIDSCKAFDQVSDKDAQIVIGRQKMARGSGTPVELYVACVLVRLEEQNTDILISLSSLAKQNINFLIQTAQSLKIVDYNLFGA